MWAPDSRHVWRDIGINARPSSRITFSTTAMTVFNMQEQMSSKKKWRDYFFLQCRAQTTNLNKKMQICLIFFFTVSYCLLFQFLAYMPFTFSSCVWGQNFVFQKTGIILVPIVFFSTLHLPPCTYWKVCSLFTLSAIQDSARLELQWIRFYKTLNIGMCNLQELHCFLSSVFAGLLLYAGEKAY